VDEKWSWSESAGWRTCRDVIGPGAQQSLTSRLFDDLAKWNVVSTGWSANGQYTGRRCWSEANNRRRTTWTVRVLEHCLQ